MTEPQIIDSPLSRVVEEGGVRVDVRIYRLENTKWSLEIVAENGTSTVWDDLFLSDEVALSGALKAIEEDGIMSVAKKYTRIHTRNSKQS